MAASAVFVTMTLSACKTEERSWTSAMASALASANPPVTRTMYWESAVYPSRIDADDTEDVVGLIQRVTHSDKGFKHEAFAGAFSGVSYEPLWIAGPFADWSANGTDVRFGAAGDRVVIGDPRLVIHVLDKKTGKQIGSSTLSDRVDYMCFEPETARTAWISTIDRKGFLVNLDNGEAKQASRPKWCTVTSRWGCGTPASCAGRGLDVPGQEWGPYHALAEGATVVVAAQKREGTPIRNIHGIDLKGKKITWSTPVAPDPLAADHSSSAADLAAGRVFATYKLEGMGGEEHLTAFDAATGHRLWDVKLNAEMSVGGVTATASRVYVRVDMGLAAFDRNNGGMLGKFRVQ